jgi:hypothetical protein
VENNSNRPGNRPPQSTQRIVAIALLDEQELRNVATGFRRVFPLPDRGDFDDLLIAIERLAK